MSREVQEEEDLKLQGLERLVLTPYEILTHFEKGNIFIQYVKCTFHIYTAGKNAYSQ